MTNKFIQKNDLSLKITAFTAFMVGVISLVLFLAFAGEASVDSPAEMCYAEKACANNTSVTCKVSGPYCDAVVTGNGVLCTGVLEDNTRGRISNKCP